MSDDLVKRLRDRGVCSPEHNSCRNDFICEQAADRIEELEAKLAKAVEALEKLARLGNGDRYGNSDGNTIARTTLAELKGEKDA
jgi:hypothetical protein